MLKKLLCYILLVSVVCLYIFPNNITLAKTKDENSEEIENIDISSIDNFDETLKKLELSKNDVLKESYRMPNDNTGVINLKDTRTSMYYNFYVEGNKVTYYSTQEQLNNGNAKFKLYNLDGTFLYSSEADKNGKVVNEETGESETSLRSSNLSATQKAALNWACLFSSKVACVGAAAGVAGGGALMGPWGAAITGSAAASACELLFTTMVEKFGGKDAACGSF